MIPTCNSGYQFFQALLQIGSIFLGWWVVHHLSIKRDIDKSRRDTISSSVDKLCELVDKIVIAAHDYHSSERDSQNENFLKRSLQDLSVRASSLKDLLDYDKCKPIWLSVVNLKRSITGQHFEDEHIGKLDKKNIQFESIAEYELELKRNLFELKHSLIKSPPK